MYGPFWKKYLKKLFKKKKKHEDESDGDRVKKIRSGQKLRNIFLFKFYIKMYPNFKMKYENYFWLKCLILNH